MVKPIDKNTLFYGDNLDILREYIPDESIDLIYLDPPFNSSRSYNVFYSKMKAEKSQNRRSPPLKIPGTGAKMPKEPITTLYKIHPQMSQI